LIYLYDNPALPVVLVIADGNEDERTERLLLAHYILTREDWVVHTSGRWMRSEASEQSWVLPLRVVEWMPS
jgi:hypothetical protein